MEVQRQSKTAAWKHPELKHLHPPPRPRTQQISAARGTTGITSSDKELKTGWTTPAQPGIKAPCRDGYERQRCGRIRSPPHVVTSTASDLTGLSFSQRKGFCSMPGIPTPGTSIRETGFLMSALENHWGLCPRAQRAREDCFPFESTCCGLSYSGSWHKRHPI